MALSSEEYHNAVNGKNTIELRTNMAPNVVYTTFSVTTNEDGYVCFHDICLDTEQRWPSTWSISMKPVKR